MTLILHAQGHTRRIANPLSAITRLISPTISPLHPGLHPRPLTHRSPSQSKLTVPSCPCPLLPKPSQPPATIPSHQHRQQRHAHQHRRPIHHRHQTHPRQNQDSLAPNLPPPPLANPRPRHRPLLPRRRGRHRHQRRCIRPGDVRAGACCMGARVMRVGFLR